MLAHKIDKAIPVAADTMTSMHLQDSRRKIEQILALKQKEGGTDVNALLASLFGADVPEGQKSIAIPMGCFDDPLLNQLAAIEKMKLK